MPLALKFPLTVLGDSHMNEEERSRFESALSLMQAAYSSFNDRRVYEWKLNLAIWAALSVVIAGLTQPVKTGEQFPLGSEAWVVSVILGFVVVIVHGYWSEGAARANAIDKGVALHYAKAMQGMLNLPFEKELLERITSLPKHVGWRQWSHLAQLAITAALVIATVVLMYVRTKH
jgi:hypothetical protein